MAIVKAVSEVGQPGTLCGLSPMGTEGVVFRLADRAGGCDLSSTVYRNDKDGSRTETLETLHILSLFILRLL